MIKEPLQEISGSDSEDATESTEESEETGAVEGVEEGQLKEID